MERDLWSRAEPILDAALDLPADQRPALLDRECAGDAELRAEVEALLADCAEADGFLDPRDPDLAEARAVPFGESEAPSPRPEERIGERLGVYRLVDILGRGGMGTVYLGERDDGLFEQSVAIKLARQGELGTEGLERFHYERRILAGLEHPNIARLFDGGISDDGLPFLVMERLEGEPLDRFCERWALDRRQRLELMIEVCRAVDHAHRRRVAHLDLKPSNILVTLPDPITLPDGIDGEEPQTPEEGRNPVRGGVKLLDFGIAELLATEGEVRRPDSAPKPQDGDPPTDPEASNHSSRSDNRSTPSSFGLTPNFASPEQLAGGTVTSTSDLYSLGVILFLLLEGNLPYERQEGESVADFAQRCVEEPIPRVDGRGSGDRELQAIVHRALARRPIERYDSAATLADDLARYLGNRPLSVLPTDPTYVLKKHFQRHRPLWILGLLASLLVGLLLFARWRDGRLAEERLRSAQRFGSEAEQIESFLRYAYALPAHDVRREKALVAERMRRIEGRMESLGELAEGPGHLALGRGHAGLHQPEEALEHLERAWQAGERSAIAAHALGRTLGEIYALERRRAYRIRDSIVREQRLRDLEERYARRIADLLEQATREPDDLLALEHLQGLAAYYGGRFDEAAKLGEEAAEATPWLPDGLWLRGDALRAKGEAAVADGDFELAADAFEGAELTLGQAAELAPSDPTLAEAQCAIHAARSHMERLRRGDLETPLAEGTDDCSRALLLDPDRADPRLLLATLRLFSIQSPSLSMDEREKRLRQADALLDEIPVGSLHVDAEAHRLRGTIRLSRAVYVERPRGDDSLPSLEEATDAFREALETDASLLEARVNLGTTLAISAEEILARGDDPRPTFDQAITNFLQAIDRAPDHAIVLHNLSNLLFRLAEHRWSLGEDPSEDFELAVRYTSRALDANPSLPMAFNLRGAAHENLGRLALAAGSDPEPSFDRAEADFAAALDKAPSYHLAWVNRSSLYLSRARWAAHRGIDLSTPAIRDSVENAIEASNEALELASGGPITLFVNRAEAHLFLAALERRAGRAWVGEPRRQLEAAREAIERAFELDADDELAQARRAAERLETARRQADDGLGSEAVAVLDRALEDLEALLERRPRLVRIRAWSAELRLWRALFADDPPSANEARRQLATLPTNTATPPRAAVLRAWMDGDRSTGSRWLESELAPLKPLLGRS